MLSLLAVLVVGCQSPTSAPDFDAFAKARNAAGVAAASVPALRDRPEVFRFLRSNGPYDVGRFGWNAVSATTPGSAKYIVFTTKITSEDYGEFVFAFNGERLTRYIPETDSLGHRIEHQRMDVRFEPAAKRANLVSTVRFRKSAGAPSEFLVRLSPHYRVSQVRDKRGRDVRFTQAGGVVWMSSAAAETFEYTLTYSGVVDLPQYAGSITNREAMLTNDYWYPMIARQPSTYEATVHVLRTWTAIAQGELLKDETSGETRTIHWKMDLPTVYWSLSAAPYRTFSQTIDGRKFQIWTLTMSEPQMQMQTELFAPILKFFETFAPYPFSYWGAVDSPVYGSGALEAYSFATYGAGWLPDEDAHEPSHTWFGGLISNTYLTSFWNESFAAYCEGLYRREGPIGNIEEKRRAFVGDSKPDPSYAQAPMSKAGAFEGPVASSLGYGKGAKVLQMLEVELGTPAMMAAMRHWVNTHPKGEPGEWEDFEEAVRVSSRRDMTTFFDEWVRRPGWADFRIENLKWEAGKVTGEAVFKGNPYHLACEVILDSSTGVRTFTSVQLTPNGNCAPFEISSPARPVLVSFDPWRKLLLMREREVAPVSIDAFLDRAKRYTAPQQSGWLASMKNMAQLAELPDDLDGVFLVGSPVSIPAIRRLCEQAGFKVEENMLTYDGTTIDLRTGAAIAVLDLPGGKRCAIGLGQTRRRPHPGNARIALVDDLGRFLRGTTDPQTSGHLTFRNP